MSKYIDVGAINWYDDLFMKGVNHSGVWVRYKDVESLIRNAPAADVEPVRHGRWIPHPGHHDFDLCSVCRTGTRRRIYEDGGEIEYNYKACPWCGAKMDAEPPKEDWNESE